MEGLTLLDRRVLWAGLDSLSWFQISSHDSVHLDKGVTQPSLVCYRLSAHNCKGSDSGQTQRRNYLRSFSRQRQIKILFTLNGAVTEWEISINSTSILTCDVYLGGVSPGPLGVGGRAGHHHVDHLPGEAGNGEHVLLRRPEAGPPWRWKTGSVGKW